MYRFTVIFFIVRNKIKIITLHDFNLFEVVTRVRRDDLRLYYNLCVHEN